MKTQKKDRRILRTQVKIERRSRPYVYEHDTHELSELLSIPKQVLQQMINEKVEDYQMQHDMISKSKGED